MIIPSGGQTGVLPILVGLGHVPLETPTSTDRIRPQGRLWCAPVARKRIVPMMGRIKLSAFAQDDAELRSLLSGQSPKAGLGGLRSTPIQIPAKCSMAGMMAARAMVV